MSQNGESGSAVQLENLTKVFGNFKAVNNVSLTVQPGEIYGFVGLNGAGKSTTIHMMLSLLKPTAGAVYLLGQRVDFNSYDLWRRVGYLEQVNFYPQLTVAENLDIARRMQGLSDPQVVPKAMDLFGLTANRNKKAKHLSLGNRQRLGLAKSMLHNPEILILDEPINGLDPAGVVEVRNALLNLAKHDGVTVFLSSHLLEELAKLADRIGIIHQGVLLQDIDMAQLENSLQKTLTIGGADILAMQSVLSTAGVDSVVASPGELVIADRQVVDRPAAINELLVKAGQAPAKLVVHAEGLEDYFLRTIGQEPAEVVGQ